MNDTITSKIEYSSTHIDTEYSVKEFSRLVSSKSMELALKILLKDTSYWTIIDKKL